MVYKKYQTAFTIHTLSRINSGLKGWHFGRVDMHKRLFCGEAVVDAGLLSYSAILHSWADSLRSHGILNEWPAFNQMECF